MKKILFLDGNARSTLALIRDVSECDEYDIYVASEKNEALCSKSKLVEGDFLYTCPTKSKRMFCEDLISLDESLKPEMIIPTTDISYLAILNSTLYVTLKEKLVMPNGDDFFRTFDKDKLDMAALKAGVDIIPRKNKDELDFPFVLKPRFSRYYINDVMYHGFRKFIKSREGYEQSIKEISKFDDNPLHQELIDGLGYGVFIAAKDGQIFEWFAHERIREYPIKGGASTYRRSIKVDDKLKETTQKLVEELKWTGIAMIEYKGFLDGKLYLMEINGRPWGSMGLAVSAGVPFGKIMLDLHNYSNSIEYLKCKYGKGYELNHYSSWVAGELLYIRALKSAEMPLFEKLKLFISILCSTITSSSYDTLRLHDVKPGLSEIFNTLLEPIRNRMKNERV